MMFKIGRNREPSEERPWDYVLVRHVPGTSRIRLPSYGDNLLPDFDNVPTWKVATPAQCPKDNATE